MATLSGLRVDNCIVEINGPEPPGLDGSANGYVAAILAAGVVEQPARRPIWTVPAPITVAAGGATIALHPATETTNLRISYLLDYGLVGPIPRQSGTLDVRPGEFVREVAGCRTFVTDREAEALRRSARVRLAWSHRQPVAICQRTRSPQDSRPHRGSRSLWLRFGRSRGCLSFRSFSQCGIGAPADGAGRSHGAVVVPQISRANTQGPRGLKSASRRVSHRLFRLVNS